MNKTGRFAVALKCWHCGDEARYGFKKGTRLWHFGARLWRTRTLKHVRCNGCGIVGELR